MDGGILKGFSFCLGSKKYSCDVVEADVEDPFITGIDFLKSAKCKIDIGNNVLEMVNGDHVPAMMKSHTDFEAACVSQVLLSSESDQDMQQNNLKRDDLGEVVVVVPAGTKALPGASAQDSSGIFKEQSVKVVLSSNGRSGKGIQ